MPQLLVLGSLYLIVTKFSKHDGWLLDDLGIIFYSYKVFH